MRQVKIPICIFITLFLMDVKVQAKSIVISTFEGKTANTESATRIMKEAYKKIGIKLIVKKLPGERAIHHANKGLVDGELYRMCNGIEKLYPNLRKVPVGILDVDFMVFTKGKHFPVKGWKSLLPYRVGYMRGAKAIGVNLVKGTKAEGVTSDEMNFRKLNKGRVDVVVTSRRRGKAILKKLGLTGIVMLKTPIHKIKSCHYLHSKRKLLVAPLTKVLQKMESVGSIKKIRMGVDRR